MTARPGIALAAAFLSLSAAATRSTGAEPVRSTVSEAVLIQRADQLLLVESADWNRPQALLQRFARPRPGGSFVRIGAPFTAWIGRAGMAWRSDRDVAEPGVQVGPRKQEGDGRSPAGVFALGDLWGYAAAAPLGVRLPYHAISDSDRCVDDPDSPDYNQLRRAPARAREPWLSAEHLRMPTDHYKLLVTIDYNHLLSGAAPRPRPRAGSCIFLHIAPPPGAATAGCTALAEADLRQIVAWLDPKKQPLLILLPTPARRVAKERWGLPPELFAP